MRFGMGVALVVAVWAGGTEVCLSAPSTWKLGVRETGIYRVGYSTLQAAGLEPEAIDCTRLRLTCKGEPVPVRRMGLDDSRWERDDWLEFYGIAEDTRYTDTNVYWLSWIGEPGPEMASAQDAPDPRGRPMVSRHRVTRHLEENRKYHHLLLAPDIAAADHWLWEPIPPKGRAEVHFDAPGLTEPSEEAGLQVVLRGSSSVPNVDPDHHTRVLLNGELVDDVRWDGAVERTCEVPLPGGLLKVAGNALVLESPGDTEAGDVDRVHLNSVEVSYWSRLQALNGVLPFTIEATGNTGVALELTGFEGEVVLYDVTDPDRPRYHGTVEAQGASIEAAFVPRADGRYLAVSAAALKAPAFIQPDRPSSLRSPANAADYIIVAADEFAEAAGPLAARRSEQGLRVVMARVSDIYDEFNHGIFSPEAIRDFVKYAWESWQRPAPEFLLLVGDASYDCRDYLGTGVRNHVPTYVAHVGGSIPTATDAYFAWVSGRDHGTDLAVGRLPVSSVEETETVVGKIVDYEQAEAGDWQRRVLFIADHEGSGNAIGRYESTCAGLTRLAHGEGLLPELIALRQIDPTAPSSERRERVRAELTPRVVEAFGQGALLVEFQGHGNERFWSRERVLTLDDVAKLEPPPGLPLCVDISCFTGWFDKPDLPGGKCLAEALLLAPGTGAIACIAPTRLGGLNLDVRLLRRLLAHRDQPIGVALREARRSFLRSHDVSVWDPVENYNLLGDPALRLRWPPQNARPSVVEERPTPVPSIQGKPDVEWAPRSPGYVDLPGGRIDTRTARPYDDRQPPDPEAKLLFIVQFRPNQELTGRRALEGAGFSMLRHVEQRAVLAQMTPGQAADWSGRAEVQWLGRLMPWHKVERSLMGKAFISREGVPVAIECVDRAAAKAVREIVGQSGGEVRTEREDTSVTTVRCLLTAAAVAGLARDERVISVVSGAPSSE